MPDLHNFDRMNAPTVILSCMQELGYVHNTAMDEANKAFETADWNRDVVVMVKISDGNIRTISFTESVNKVPNAKVPPDEFKQVMAETLYDHCLNGAYIIEKYGEFFYAMPHTVEELQFDARYQCLFPMAIM